MHDQCAWHLIDALIVGDGLAPSCAKDMWHNGFLASKSWAYFLQKGRPFPNSALRFLFRPYKYLFLLGE